jgi:Uma2 family endonuclease
MAESTLAPDQSATPQPVDRELFSLHPEDQMTERPSHRLQSTYLEHALRRLLPDWFVAGNMGVYWVPGEFEFPYVSPDVLVAGNRPQREDSAVFYTPEDGPLTLVAEIASPGTRNIDRRKRDTEYALELAVPWYLWIDLPRRVLELYRLVEGRYELVPPDAAGQIQCSELHLGFAWQADRRLVRVIAADGTIVLTADEEAALRQAAEVRAEQETRRAEALAAEVERLRRALDAVRDTGADEESR